MKDDIENDVRKLKELCKDRYRFYVGYTNNSIDENKGYWLIEIYPYIKGYKELKSKSRSVYRVVDKRIEFLEKQMEARVTKLENLNSRRFPPFYRPDFCLCAGQSNSEGYCLNCGNKKP